MRKKQGARKIPAIRVEKEEVERGDGRKFVFYWFHTARNRARTARKKS